MTEDQLQIQDANTVPEPNPPPESTNENEEDPQSVYKDTSQLHPRLSDFETIEHDTASVCPYKWIVYGGNYWDTMTKVIRPRGFNLVKTKDDHNLTEINFIWRPIQFSYLVIISNIISITQGSIKKMLAELDENI